MTNDGTVPPPAADLPTQSPAPVRRGLHPALKIVLVLFALLTTSCVGCVALGYRTTQNGASYFAAELPRIAQPWSPDALIARVSPEYLAVAPPDKSTQFVTYLDGKLGALQQMGPVHSGQWTTFVGIRGIKVVTRHWSDCQFEKAPARVTVTLLWSSEGRKIQAFYVNSDALMH